MCLDIFAICELRVRPFISCEGRFIVECEFLRGGVGRGRGRGCCGVEWCVYISLSQGMADCHGRLGGHTDWPCHVPVDWSPRP